MSSQTARPEAKQELRPELWARDYEINSLLINTQGRLGLYALLNLLQDVGWSHAHALGHGHHDTAGRKAMWVLTRQRTKVTAWPEWGSKITIQTWLRPPQGVFANRDYEILYEGKKIAEATSSFLLLNNETRKPMREDLAKLGFPVRTDGALDFDAEKIQPQTEVVTLAQFQVRNSDIDMNQHVNNTRYAQWVLDAIPFSSHSRFNLKEYEVNFIAETKAGDVITIQEARANADVSNGQVFFQGFREADSKVTFTVRMRIENR